MNVEVKRLRGKYRLVEAGTVKLARTSVNHVPVDGGGKIEKAAVARQAGYVNGGK